MDAETKSLIKEMLAVQRERNAVMKLARGGANKYQASPVPYDAQRNIYDSVRALDAEIARLAAAVAAGTRTAS